MKTMIAKWHPDDVVSTKEQTLLSGKSKIPFKIETGFYRSLSTAKGIYYLVYDDEAYKNKCEINSYKLILYDGNSSELLMRNLWIWKNRFDDCFLVFSSFSNKAIYLIDSRGVVFEISSYSGYYVTSCCEVDIDREKGCYLINGTKIFYQTSEEREAFQKRIIPEEGVSYNKDFNRFIRSNAHNATGYLYLTAGTSKCGEMIKYFADMGMRVETVPNIICDDSTINVRIPLDEENAKREDVQFLCCKYSNQFSIFNVPYEWIGGGLSFPGKWKQKKYDLGLILPKGKETITYYVINNLRAAFRTTDDYGLYKKTLSKIVRLFERGSWRPSQNVFSDLLLLHPNECYRNIPYVLERLGYINTLLVGTEEIRQQDRIEHMVFLDSLEKEGFAETESIEEIDDVYLKDKLTAEDVSNHSSRYNYLYQLAFRKSIQLYKEKMAQFESQALKDMSQKGYRISKWKNESNLFSIVAREYPDAIYQFRCKWLGQQSIDVYIPSLKVGIEYQGEQHYRPISFFGGEKAFEDLIRRDLRKQKLCRDNGVNLIIWKYDEAVSKIVLEKKLRQTLGS